VPAEVALHRNQVVLTITAEKRMLKASIHHVKKLFHGSKEWKMLGFEVFKGVWDIKLLLLSHLLLKLISFKLGNLNQILVLA